MLNIKISLQFIIIAGDAVNTKARIRLIVQIHKDCYMIVVWYGHTAARKL
jgi:hypothetical protein